MYNYYREKCPNCNTNNAITIIYGEPDLKLMKHYEQGEIILGGCVIGLDDPVYYCVKCRMNIFHDNNCEKSEEYNTEYCKIED